MHRRNNRLLLTTRSTDVVTMPSAWSQQQSSMKRVEYALHNRHAFFDLYSLQARGT
jgi:hypothetical protein